MTPGGRRPLDLLKLIILILLGAFWMYRAHWDMLNSIVSNSHFGKRCIAWEMAASGFHVGAECVNSY